MDMKEGGSLLEIYRCNHDKSPFSRLRKRSEEYMKGETHSLTIIFGGGQMRDGISKSLHRLRLVLVLSRYCFNWFCFLLLTRETDSTAIIKLYIETPFSK